MPLQIHDSTPGTREPAVRQLVRLLIGEIEHVTLLAVCPNSEAVARAALHAAHEADAPLLLAATLNQVDVDGGYTGWTPAELVRFFEEEAARMGFDGPLLPCLDHGGPWLKDDHARAGLSLEEATAAVRRSIEACLNAGYALLHIDPTVDRSLPRGTPPPIEQVVQRTLDLIEHAETYRREQDLPPVSYEVGTEEVAGGLADVDAVEDFLERLDAGLAARDLSEAWPCFVVGKVGTDLHTSTFDPDMARRLTEKVRSYGALLKGHYTDGVRNPEDYPLSGMGGANVGPGFSASEYDALMELVALERKIGCDSGLEEALRSAVVESGRWTKWLQPDEEGAAFEELPPERQRWLVSTGSRYIWTQPAVVEARQRLYDNLRGIRNADAFVVWRVKQAILEYYHAFNLVGFNERVESVLH